jgi:hypothetical protein
MNEPESTPTDRAELIQQQLRAGTCQDLCRVKDARRGCTCAEAADAIKRLQRAALALAEIAEATNSERADDPAWVIGVAKAALS